METILYSKLKGKVDEIRLPLNGMFNRIMDEGKSLCTAALKAGEHIRCPFDKVLVNISDDKLTGGAVFLVTRDGDDGYIIDHFSPDITDAVVAEWRVNTENGDVTMRHRLKGITNDTLNTAVTTVSMICQFLWAYTVYHSDTIRAEERQEVKERLVQKRGKTKVQKTILTRTVYVYEGNFRHRHIRHSKPDHEFGVRGHWRHYKNGKAVWVNPCRKCVGRGYRSKEYGFKAGGEE